MDSPRGRPGRTPVSVKPIAAALAVALMGMGGVALAAPKADQGAPAQGNGPAPQAQENGSTPAQGNAPAAQAQDSAPATQGKAPAPKAQHPAPPPQAKAKGHQGGGKPAEVPAQPPQGGGSDPASGGGQSGNSGRHRGRPAPGEVRGQGHSRGNCHSAACRGAAPKPEAGASEEQPLPVSGQQDPAGGAAPGGSEGRPHRGRTESDSGDGQSEAPETGSVLGANQGGDEQAVEADTRSFDTALPFTGFEVVLLAAIGALLWLVGVRLRRSTA
jgi:hypothetical protein